MAKMILTYRVMPEDGEMEYETLQQVVKDTMEAYDETLNINSLEAKNMGFGLQAVLVNFNIEETKGSEELEEKLKELPEVGDVVVESMSRAMG